jgi:hypothetical protein
VNTVAIRTALSLLWVVFLVLKIAGVIDWSWWWVTSPLWLPVVPIAVLLVIYQAVESYRFARDVVRRELR